MRVSEVYEILNKISPFELQEKWDNSGLQVGSLNQEVKKIVLSIDVDDELLDSLDEDTLLITHHPLIFSGLKELDFDKYPATLIQKMIVKKISNIAMHTNFDITHLNDYVVKDILGYEVVKKDGFLNYIEVNEDFDIFAKKIKEKLSLNFVKNVKSKDFIKTAALTTGSGASQIPFVGADCFITGDIKYHDAMGAKAINMSLIDIGHFESEHYFAQILQSHLKNSALEAIIASSKNPFTYK